MKALSRSLFTGSDYIESLPDIAAPGTFICYICDGDVMTSFRILISGASGFIGTALVPSLEARGTAITRLARGKSSAGAHIAWDPSQSVNPEVVSGFDGVIHLAGEPIAGVWTKEKRKRIFESRVHGTAHLCDALARASRPPRVMICASAIGYYGDRGDETLSEGSASGDGFLPEVCRQWEAATKPASDAGVRTVQIRTGVVLSADGGALQKMLLPFRIGLGALLGDGRQWMSWIHLEDLVSAILYILNDDARQGPVNLVAPAPVRNSEFTETLASVLSRSAMFRIPEFAVRLAFGEMGKEVLLASQRVSPDALLASGYKFIYQDLGSALANILEIPSN
ncbi:MAG: TIGR01777 family oxidoreductase [Terriglobales bacterium]